MKVTAFWKDAFERVAWTFAQGAAGAFLAVGLFDLETAKAAAVAGLVGVMSVIKVLAAKQIGDKDSAAIG